MSENNNKFNFKINDNIIISKRVNDCYLLYTGEKYYLLKDECKPYTINIADNPDEVEQTLNIIDGIIKDNNISTNNNYNPNLVILQMRLEMMGFDEKKVGRIIQETFEDLADVYTGHVDRLERFKAVPEESIIKEIEAITIGVERAENEAIIGGIHKALKSRINVGKAQRDLGDYLNRHKGIILRINSHELYKLDVVNNGYNSISIDEIIAELTITFNEKNIIGTKDVEYAVEFISDRLTPEYNVVKLGNGLYDMKQHCMVEPDEPVFTLVETPFNYNPDAKGELIQDYLKSTFERDTPAETEKMIKGVLQVIGYLFTSGNEYNTLIFLTGIGGSGKGTMASIIEEVFRGNTTQLDLSEIEKDIHATSILVGKHLNIVKESDSSTVKNNKFFKLLAGNDSISVNPKHQKPYIVPAEEVPKPVMNFNNLPNFVNPDISILQRMVVIEFKTIFRNADNVIRDLAKIITSSPDDMEWLIYHGLEAYREMVEANEDFILRLSEDETLALLYKHSQPLNYLVRKLILKHDPEAFTDDVELSADNVNGETEFIKPYILTDELNELIIYLAEKEGIQIPLEKNTGKASSKGIMKAIKDEFDLHDYYIETDAGGNKKYQTIKKRINGEPSRYYPELIKTPEYNKLLKEMRNKNKK